MCDHTIGYLHDWVTVSNVKKTLESEATGWNNHSKTMNSLTKGNEKVLKDSYKSRDFLDGRKGYCMNMFKHCPDCGEKISWNKIKKAI